MKKKELTNPYLPKTLNFKNSSKMKNFRKKISILQFLMLHIKKGFPQPSRR